MKSGFSCTLFIPELRFDVTMAHLQVKVRKKVPVCSGMANGDSCPCGPCLQLVLQMLFLFTPPPPDFLTVMLICHLGVVLYSSLHIKKKKFIFFCLKDRTAENGETSGHACNSQGWAKIKGLDLWLGLPRGEQGPKHLNQLHHRMR